MRLAEALKINQAAAPPGDEKYSVYLACGFQPLHLATFLVAHLRQLAPERQSDIRTGSYGDLSGNLDRLRESSCDGGVALFEWSDFDSRLGLRALGGWGPGILPDILQEVRWRAARYLQLLEAAAGALPLVICIPTLPLPPLSYEPAAQEGLFQLQLREAINTFALEASQIRGIKIVSSERLDALSPLAERLDVKTELAAGFPYRTAHADHLSSLLARLLRPMSPKKGLITDLDDTFWRGLVGENGPNGVSWELDRRSHIHALYQQTLKALAESGVLIGVASKNSSDLVHQALARPDLLLSPDQIFPVEANWKEKSQSIKRILRDWNIGADSVVFVDDSPLELSEVQSVYPEMHCLQFPTKDDQAAYLLLEQLRDLFGKDEIRQEDSFRLQSIRLRASLGEDEVSDEGNRSADEFLRQLDAELTFDLPCDATDAVSGRALELINKTNQFNLNGRRLSTAEFNTLIARPDSFLLVVSYRDKYGPLGKIAAAIGQRLGTRLRLESWVMSCRAFSRRIEHMSLDYLFEKFGSTELTFNFTPMPKNRPMEEFLRDIIGADVRTTCTLSRETFMARKPLLVHHVRETTNA